MLLPLPTQSLPYGADGDTGTNSIRSPVNKRAPEQAAILNPLLNDGHKTAMGRASRPLGETGNPGVGIPFAPLGN